MPDDWELTYGLNPLVNDASVDSDGDGYSNLVEYYKRTNPVVNELASTTQEQRYYILNPSVGGGALNIASLADSNSITSSSTTLTLNNYQQGTIPASDLGQGSVISGSGPFDVASNIDDTDILTPAQFAGKVFVIPHFRNSHTYYLLSPNGNANVSVSVGSTNVNLVLTQGVVTTYNAGSDNTVSGVIISSPMFPSLWRILRASTMRRTKRTPILRTAHLTFHITIFSIILCLTRKATLGSQLHDWA